MNAQAQMQERDELPSLADIPRKTRHPEPVWTAGFYMSEVPRYLDRWAESPGLDLDPWFQRPHVWTDAQRSAWLETVITRAAGGRRITLNCPNWQGRSEGILTLVDGKQRLETIRRWYAGQASAFGRTIHQWADGQDRRLGGETIEIVLYSLRDEIQVLESYLQHNAGGTPHSREEMERVEAGLGRIRGK